MRWAAFPTLRMVTAKVSSRPARGCLVSIVALVSLTAVTRANSVCPLPPLGTQPQRPGDRTVVIVSGADQDKQAGHQPGIAHTWPPPPGVNSVHKKRGQEQPQSGQRMGKVERPPVGKNVDRMPRCHPSSVDGRGGKRNGWV